MNSENDWGWLGVTCVGGVVSKVQDKLPTVPRLKRQDGHSEHRGRVVKGMEAVSGMGYKSKGSLYI